MFEKENCLLFIDKLVFEKETFLLYFEKQVSKKAKHHISEFILENTRLSKDLWESLIFLGMIDNF